jgi:hypothetical protein
MEPSSIPQSIFEPIKQLSNVDNNAGIKDKVTKLDEYLSDLFLIEYFSNK